VTLYPGDYVEMEIAVDGPEEALSIPLRALRKDVEGKDYAWVLQRASSEPWQAKYTCVMHPEVVEDQPGKCPRCGMDLVPQERTGDLKAHRQPVKPGQASGTRVAILEGLEPGDRVIVQGFQDLEEGTAVAVVEWGPEGPVTLPEATSPMEGMPGHGGHGGPSTAAPAGEHEGHTMPASPGPENHTMTPGAGHEGHTMPSSPQAAVWTCPMHPEVRSDQPGTCPKCGMDLVKEEKP